MAEEFKVLIGTELDTASIDSLKQQISGIKTNPVKIKIDTSDVTSQINKNSLSDSPTLIFCGFPTQFYKNSPTFLPKTLDKPVKKCGASRLLTKKALFIPAQPVSIF